MHATHLTGWQAKAMQHHAAGGISFFGTRWAVAWLSRGVSAGRERVPLVGWAAPLRAACLKPSLPVAVLEQRYQLGWLETTWTRTKAHGLLFSACGSRVTGYWNAARKTLSGVARTASPVEYGRAWLLWPGRQIGHHAIGSTSKLPRDLGCDQAMAGELVWQIGIWNSINMKIKVYLILFIQPT